MRSENSEPASHEDTSPENASSADTARPNWLARQWQRLRRGKAAGDTILAQVGEEARHVVVGKNIIQIGTLAIPMWLVVLIAGGVVLGVGSGIIDRAAERRQLTEFEQRALAPTATPTLTPVPTPTPTPPPVVMDGTLFNIAVAEFGELDADGNIQASELGARLSRLLFTGMQGTDFRQLPFLAPGDMLIWYLAEEQAARHITDSVIRGQTPVARGAQAEALAERIEAQMIINGYLTVADDPGSLALEFYYRPDQHYLRNQPDAIGGRHELGQPLEFSVRTPLDPSAVQMQMTEPLRFRSQILLWLSLGLTFDVQGVPERALDIFRTAEAELDRWPNDDGKELLYYLIGRSALYLRRHEEARQAFAAALEIRPDYANALLGMGSVHFDRAQLFYLRDRPILDGVDQCTDAADVASGAETAAEARAEITQALDYFQRAFDAAPTAPWPPIAQIAQLNLGLGYWLHGQADAVEGQSAAAAENYAQAVTRLDATLAPFADAEQIELLGHAYLGLGVTHFAWGNLLARQQDATGSQEQLTAAFAQLSRCVDLADDLRATRFLQEQIVECGCEPYRGEAEQAILAGGGGEG
ncbi:MAG: tetratricopeptide repeat protein [Litorilinea sp.]